MRPRIVLWVLACTAACASCPPTEGTSPDPRGVRVEAPAPGADPAAAAPAAPADAPAAAAAPTESPAAPAASDVPAAAPAPPGSPVPPEGLCKAGPVKEPYRWYPDLDLARVPFHAGSGPFGERMPIHAPEPPKTKGPVTVHSAHDLLQAMMTPGSEVIIGTSIDEDVIVRGDVVDIDLVVPRGKYVRGLTVGRYNPPSKTHRVRIRGPFPGKHSGGLLGTLRFYSEQTSDVIIDGVDLNGHEKGRMAGLWYFREHANRIAIVNVRGHSAGLGGLQKGVKNFVMAGNTILTGSRTRVQNGFPESWDVRGGDHLVYFRNYMRGTRYHRIRVHPQADRVQYAWIAENTFIDPHEARIVAAMRVGGTPPGEKFDALWVQCNQVYAHSTCMGSSFDALEASYGRVTDNRIYGSIRPQVQERLQSRAVGDHDYMSRNEFNPWKKPPAPPRRPGDPRKIKLPPELPGDDKPHLAPRKACPAPSG